MFSRMRHSGGVPLTALVLGVSSWIFTSSSAIAQVGVSQGDGVPATALAVTGIPTALRDDWSGGPVRWNPYDPPATGYAGMGDSVIHSWLWEQGVAFDYARHHAVGPGSLGYATSGNGEFGVYPGFHGFGMSFSRGYGYGGDGLGVGANGGYPYYGGPGYPRGGYCYPGPMFASEGPFGPFTGPPPYPEAYFAPYTAAAATTGSASGTAPFDPFSTPSIEARAPPVGLLGAGAEPDFHGPRAHYRLGIQDESVVNPDGTRGLKSPAWSPHLRRTRPASRRATSSFRSMAFTPMYPGTWSGSSPTRHQ